MIPGKTQEELDREYYALKAEVEKNVEILKAYRRRNRRLGRDEFFILGLLIGAALMTLVLGLSRYYHL